MIQSDLDACVIRFIKCSLITLHVCEGHKTFRRKVDVKKPLLFFIHPPRCEPSYPWRTNVIKTLNYFSLCFPPAAIISGQGIRWALAALRPLCADPILFQGWWSRRPRHWMTTCELYLEGIYSYSYPGRKLWHSCCIRLQEDNHFYKKKSRIEKPWWHKKWLTEKS